MFKFIIFLSSIMLINCARLLSPPPPPHHQLIGGDPKTWSVQTELDCTTCKVLIATLETDACLKIQDTRCIDFFEKYGEPGQVCEKLGICH